MSASTPAPLIVRARPSGMRPFLSDTLLLTGRNVRLALRTPQLLALASITPAMFVLLFRYVFGGSIHVPGYPSYVDYLIPGIIVQTSLFGGSSSAVGVAEDMAKGVTDRLRALPTSRTAILAARTLADLLRLAYTIALLIALGLLVGFRFGGTPWEVAAGLAVALLFGYACSWLFTLLGLVVRDAESATMAGFLVTFPVVFASSIFTAPSTFPDWLETFAEAQPVTRVTDALRGLCAGTASLHTVESALAWSLGILVVSAVLATWRFRRL
jgi:ABC-2 type transport system permease protein